MCTVPAFSFVDASYREWMAWKPCKSSVVGGAGWGGKLALDRELIGVYLV